MDVTVTIPEEQLTQLTVRWFAVRWSRFALEDKVNMYHRTGQPCAYDEACLQTIMEVENFLEGLWVQYMDNLQEKLRIAQAKLDQVPTNV